MPILSTNPITSDGKTYDRLAVHLALSPAWGEVDLGPSIAIRVIPYRKDENGLIDKLEGVDAAFNFTKLVSSDPFVEQKVRELLAAVQDIVNAKGL